MKKRDYPNRVGAGLWLARGSKPEISWTVGMMSRFLTNPGLKHWDMSEHLLTYLSSTRDRGLVYRRTPGPLVLEAYVDGDWLTDYGNDTDNRKCCTGYALLLGGAAVSWRSFKQQRVAGSSTESEYYSLWAAVREVMHTRRQMKECGFEQFEPSIIHEDNQAVKRLSEDVVESTRTRHWDKEYHQLREEFERETMKVEYVDTRLNASDCLTKSLCVELHQKHTTVLCGKDWHADSDLEYQQQLSPDQRSPYGKEHVLESGTTLISKSETLLLDSTSRSCTKGTRNHKVHFQSSDNFVDGLATPKLHVYVRSQPAVWDEESAQTGPDPLWIRGQRKVTAKDEEAI